MEIKEIKGNTFCIDTGMTYIPFYKINNEEIIMLDSGWAEGEREGIDKLLEKNKFKVAAIICSHAHIDHVGNNAYLKKKYNCIIAMPAYEALICSSTVNLKLYYNIQTLSEVTEHFGHMVCETDIMISDNQDSITVRDIKFKIIHTPGHSPAHICITTPDDVAYLGDTLISYEVMRGAKMPYAYILSEDLKSKLKLYDLKYSKYVVAHKGMYDDITELITDNINFYKGRASRIYTVIEGSMTMEDILKAVIENFNIHVKSKYRYTIIVRMLRSYVEYLNETGMIELNMDKGFLKYSKASSYM
ncbi:MBL fold metallo-hydrolase [Clostridium tagluense]|uniref:MBL fold metallo-hydrolase n=1 Tax=Clostridium TaxID=1485 RepID=UPI0013E94970|nr:MULTISPECIES: MBL fold metallo-hydrolase [Clostridium]MBW9158761.1 MBL fold metallo-hydrolase [Clostridium tagluense]MBZ9622227.1 MBL fold metallo-hydrolase [Clostridium sp. FP2]MCB2310355.1 MBL fold metallo-hydrolase [Clostridium tagluense]MCB2315003.1 MBL fold metallo-hydrolase [Clostridium tagluense]MCB2320056.1 MBL fold metallo-hydrolase [Clostridium tagluense]